MNREIKFRQPLFTNDTEFRHFHYWGFDSDGFTGPETHYTTIREAHKVSQQFTGIKDKNGVRIYEGDILSYTNDGMEKAAHRCWHGVVEFGVNDDGDEWQRYHWPSFHVKNLIYKPEVCEVIGNIYENAELLALKSQYAQTTAEAPQGDNEMKPNNHFQPE